MADNIDTRVTPALHPDNIAALDGVDDETQMFVAPATDALTAAYTYLGSIHDVRAAAFSDPTLTEPAALLRADDHARGKLEGVTRKLDAAVTQMGRTIASYEKDLLAPVTAKASVMVSTEIRAHLKAAPDRFEIVRKAIREGDHEVASAALGAPPMLSGLSPEMHRMLLIEYGAAREPAIAKRLTALRSAKAYLEANAGKLLSESERAVGVVQVPIPGPDGKTTGFRAQGPDAFRKQRDAATAIYKRHA